jgi:hypothetical protein
MIERSVKPAFNANCGKPWVAMSGGYVLQERQRPLLAHSVEKPG